MKNRFFITSTGTGIGKTFITAALVDQARAMKKTVAAYKPLISGFDPANLYDSDTGVLLESLGREPTPENIARVSPWRFKEPLAPSMAARLEGREIDSDALAEWTREAAHGPEDICLIEGVGGIMVPINERRTVLDWLEGSGLPAVLVTGTYLGTISHTLTALTVIEHRKIPVAAIILNESENSSVTLGETADELRRWTKVPVLQVQRREFSDGWKSAEKLGTFFT